MTKRDLRLFRLALLLTSSLAQTTPTLGADNAHRDVRVFPVSYFLEFEPDTAQDLVKRVPGFRIQETGGGRGLAEIRTNVLINGVRPPLKGQTTESLLQQLPLRQVDTIELIQAGARPDIDMQGYSQVLNVVTKKGVKPFLEAIYKYDKIGVGDVTSDNSDAHTGTARGSIEFGGHKLSANAEMMRSDVNKPGSFVQVNPANPEQRIGSPSRTENQSDKFETAGAFEFGKHSVVVNGVYSQASETREPIVLNGGDADAVLTTRATSSDQMSASLEYRAALTDAFEATANFVYSSGSNAASNQLTAASSFSESLSEQTTGETAGRASLRWKRSDQLTLTANANLAHNSFENAVRRLDNGIERDLGAPIRVTELRSGADMDANWQPAQKIIAQANLGLERYEIENGPNATSAATNFRWRTNLTYKFEPNRQLVFEAGRSIGQLDLDRFAASTSLESDIVSLGAARLSPEQTQTYSILYDHRFQDRGVIEIKLERRQIVNAISQVPVSPSETIRQNVGPETVNELSAKFDLPLDDLIGLKDGLIYINATLAESNTTDPVTGEERSVTNVGGHNIRMGVQKDPGDTNWGFNLRYTHQDYGRQYRVRNIFERLPVDSWTGSIEWRGVKDVTMLFNITNRQLFHYENNFFDEPRRAGLQPSFQSVGRFRRGIRYHFNVEWRPRRNVEVNFRYLNSGARENTRAVAPFGADSLDFTTLNFGPEPEFNLRLRVTN